MKASLPLCEGGLGLRSAVRSRPAAHWASWADALKMIKQRHPGVANMIISSLARHEKCSSIQSLLMCVDALEATGFEVPSWEDLVEGRRPEGTSEDDPCQATHWMAEASRDVPREAVSVKGRVALITRKRTSHALVAARTNGKYSTYLVPYRPSFQVRLATLPHSPSSPPSVAPLPVCPQLPV